MISACPECSDDRYTQKVSAVFRAQSSGPATTELARLLRPPRSAPPNDPWRDLGWWLLGAAPIAFAIVWLVLANVSDGFRWGGRGGSPYALLGVIAATVGAAVPVLAIRALLAQRRLARTRAQKWAEPYANAFSRWEDSYYCSKHDLIFSGPTSAVCSPTDLLVP
jgi:hypothetical protein